MIAGDGALAGIDRRLLPVAAVTAAIVVLGVWPQPLLEFATRAAETLPPVRP